MAEPIEMPFGVLTSSQDETVTSDEENCRRVAICTLSR